MRRLSHLILTKLVPLRPILIACLAIMSLTGQAHAAPITVFAAASLKGALDEAAQSYEGLTGQEIRISYAGSSVLARQIILGAPADLFISANEAWMNAVQETGHIDADTRVNLLGNTLVLIAPSSTVGPDNLDNLGGFLDGRKIAIGLVDAVPAGIYGKAALEQLGQWDTIAALVAQTDNVRAALALVALEQTPLGIVYASDAMAEPRVRIVATFAPESHPAITYPAAVVTNGNDVDASDFLSWLAQPIAKDIFQRHGFIPLTPS